MDLRNLTFAINIKGNEGPVVKTDRAMDDLAKTTGKATKELESASDGIKDLGSDKNIHGVEKSKEKIDGLTKSLGDNQKSLKDAAKVMDKMGKSFFKKVTLPVIALGTAAIKTVSTFDDSMSKVQALSGATTKEFKKMRDMAKDLGSTTAHSASAASDAMAILASSGYQTNQILEVTPQLLSLASAGGLELASSADILTGTIAQFGLKAEDANTVADAMAKAV